MEAMDAQAGYQLECRWTFLDFRECEGTNCGRRSQSEPPPYTRGEEDELEDGDDQDQDYFTSLPQRLATWTAPACPGSGTEPEVSEVPVLEEGPAAVYENPAKIFDEDVLDSRTGPVEAHGADERRPAGFPSEGSVGHPHVCKRPCVYFAKGDCEFEEACNYCHLEHTKNRIVLDKRQREQLRALTEVQVWSLLLPHLKAKAAQWTLLSDPLPVVRLAENRFADLQQEAEVQEVPRRLASAVSRSLKGLSFGALVGLAASHLPEQADVLNAAVEGLRTA